MPRKRKGNPVSGWINLNKPYEMGSTKAVGRVRYAYQAQKAGHAGTLDPLASGVLPIALGEATKTVPFLVDADKAYTFDVAFGAETATGDIEGDVVETSDHRPSRAEIEAALPGFIGLITQVPPRYSAIKIDGKRAYDLARAGEDVVIPSREVRVDDLSVESFDGQTARLIVACGKGTYVRSIARDLARALGTVGHVTFLQRTKVGPFTLSDAVELGALEDQDARGPALLNVGVALSGLRHIAVDESDVSELGFGRAFACPGEGDGLDIVARYGAAVVAIGRIEGGMFHPRKVLAQD